MCTVRVVQRERGGPEDAGERETRRKKYISYVVEILGEPARGEAGVVPDVGGDM